MSGLTECLPLGRTFSQFKRLSETGLQIWFLTEVALGSPFLRVSGQRLIAATGCGMGVASGKSLAYAMLEERRAFSATATGQ